MRITLALLAVATCILTGCAMIAPGPGQPLPAVLFNSTTTPSWIGMNELYAAYPDSFVIVGMVEGHSTNTNILSLFAFGNGGYMEAVNDALSQVDADGIINPIVDVQSHSFLGIIAESKTTVRAYAIKKRR